MVHKLWQDYIAVGLETCTLHSITLFQAAVEASGLGSNSMPRQLNSYAMHWPGHLGTERASPWPPKTRHANKNARMESALVHLGLHV